MTTYEPLSKLYYKVPEQYEAIYRERCQGTYTLPIDFTIHEQPAFLVQTPELFYSLIAIYKMQTDILFLYRNLPGVAIRQFTRRCLIDEIVLTNGIEGVSSTRRDVGCVLKDLQQRDRRRRFQGLVQKYDRLQKREKLPLESCADLRRLYDELVLAEVREEDPQDVPDGEIFRKEAVEVHSPAQKVIHTGVYPEAAIREGVDKALRFLHREEVDPLIRAAVFHYLLGYIHPFYNGNGRLARFVSSYTLSRELNPLLGYRLSYTIKEHLQEYYRAFEVCNDPRSRGDVTPFVQMFLRIVQVAAERLRDALRQRLMDMSTYSGALARLPIAQRDENRKLGNLLIQAQLFSEKGIAIDEMLEWLQISRSTLRTRLKGFEKLGLLLPQREGRYLYYGMNLPVLSRLDQDGRRAGGSIAR